MSDLICLSQNCPPLLHLKLRHTIKFQQRKKLLSIRGDLITSHFYGLKIQQRWHLINLTQLSVLLILGWNKPVFATGWASSRETDCMAQLTLNSWTQTQFETLFYLPAWLPHCSWETDSQGLSEAQGTPEIRGTFHQHFLVAQLLTSPLCLWRRQYCSPLGCLVGPKPVRWHPTRTPCPEPIHTASYITPEDKEHPEDFLPAKVS